MTRNRSKLRNKEKVQRFFIKNAEKTVLLLFVSSFLLACSSTNDLEAAQNEPSFENTTVEEKAETQTSNAENEPVPWRPQDLTVPEIHEGSLPMSEADLFSFELLRHQLQDFITAFQTETYLGDFFEGHRLIIVTGEYAEVGLDEEGKLDPSTEIIVGTGCETGFCYAEIGELFNLLERDLHSRETAAYASEHIDPAFASWPAFVLHGPERFWNLSFGPDGTALIAIEVQGLNIGGIAGSGTTSPN